REFLANVGPIALKAASVAEAARRKAKPPAPEKRRTRRVTPPAPGPMPEIPAAATLISEPAPELIESSPTELPVSLPAPAAAQGVVEAATEELMPEPTQDE